LTTLDVRTTGGQTYSSLCHGIVSSYLNKTALSEWILEIGYAIR
jgi:hypothetical protein